MRSIKKVVLLTISLLLLNGIIAQAGEWYRGLIHAHSTCSSDSLISPEDLALMAKGKGYQIFIPTDHADSFKGLGHYTECMSRFAQFSDQDFLVITGGREVTVGAKEGYNCHLTVISYAENPYLYNPYYSPEMVGELAKKLHREENAFVGINHIRDCPQWRWLREGFDSFELFNDINYKKTPHAMFDYQFNLYLDTQKSNGGPAVIAGADYHRVRLEGKTPVIKLRTGEFDTPMEAVTMIYAEELTREAVMEALWNHRTIGLNSGYKIISFDPIPSQIPIYRERDVTISGKLLITPILAPGDNGKVHIYKNGKYLAKVKLEKKEKQKSGGRIYTFSFTDKGPVKEMVSYIVKLPYHMVTSPIVVSPPSLPLPETPDKPTESDTSLTSHERAFLIRDIAFMYRPRLMFVNVDPAYQTIVDEAEYLIICEDSPFFQRNGASNLVKNSQGQIVNCRRPKEIIRRTRKQAGYLDEIILTKIDCKPYERSLGILGRSMSSCDLENSEKGYCLYDSFLQNANEECYESFEPKGNLYAILPKRDEYYCAYARYANIFACYMESLNKDIQKDEVFDICDYSDSNIRFDDTGKAISCQPITTGKLIPEYGVPLIRPLESNRFERYHFYHLIKKGP